MPGMWHWPTGSAGRRGQRRRERDIIVIVTVRRSDDRSKQTHNKYIYLQTIKPSYSVNSLQIMCHTHHLHRELANKSRKKSQLKPVSQPRFLWWQASRFKPNFAGGVC